MCKEVIVTFDCESVYGMPIDDGTYDFSHAITNILRTLEIHQVKATFFVVGKLFETQPKIIKRIHDAGHEIGIHGYKHEHINQLTQKDFEAFLRNLSKAEQRAEKITGSKPVSFRSPYLSGPDFYDKRLYEELAKRGYKCISNREIRTPEELFLPGRLPWGLLFTNYSCIRFILCILLNSLLLRNDIMSGMPYIKRLAWLANPLPFRRRNGLIEHPLISPLDCDLLGLPETKENSNQRRIALAKQILKKDFDNAREYYNLNCHDWIIGTANRTEILQSTFQYIQSSNESSFVTLKESSYNHARIV